MSDKIVPEIIMATLEDFRRGWGMLSPKPDPLLGLLRT